jgi:hypothetical protein
MVLVIVVPITVWHIGCGNEPNPNVPLSRGENCASCIETALEQERCVELGFDHAVLRSCGDGPACLFCADQRGVLTPVENPHYPQGPATTKEAK